MKVEAVRDKENKIWQFYIFGTGNRKPENLKEPLLDFSGNKFRQMLNSLAKRIGISVFILEDSIIEYCSEYNQRPPKYLRKQLEQ